VAVVAGLVGVVSPQVTYLRYPHRDDN
jgi:hypothetical protein